MTGRNRAHWAIAYVLVALSAGLAGWQGMKGADTFVDAGLRSAVMAAIAIAGCHGWAWAARTAKEGHGGWATISWLVLTVAMGVTLIGGASSVYNATSDKQATFRNARDAYDRADTALDGIDKARKKLTSHRSKGEIVPEIKTMEASGYYRNSNGCDPGYIQGRDMREHCKNFRLLDAELAAALEDERLTNSAKPHEEIIAKGKPIAPPSSGQFLVALLGTSEEFGNALFALLCSLALDGSALVALLTAELRPGHAPPRELREMATQVSEAVPAALPELPAPVQASEILAPTRAKPRLVSPPVLSVHDFALSNDGLRRCAEARLEYDDFYFAYVARARRDGKRYHTPDEWKQPLTRLCQDCSIPIVSDNGTVYLVGVTLASAVPQLTAV
jgi:hypothetical protein